jgi:hypothetical protein
VLALAACEAADLAAPRTEPPPANIGLQSGDELQLLYEVAERIRQQYLGGAGISSSGSVATQGGLSASRSSGSVGPAPFRTT